jgi:hypothetical protein
MSLSSYTHSCQHTTAQNISLPQSFIQSLPHEILGDIFHIHLFASNNPQLQELSKIGTILRLVCHRWNLILLDLSLCWSNIHLDMKQLPSFLSLTLWLERSKNAPLSITIRTPWAESIGIPEYLDFLADSIVRWRVLEFPIPIVLPAKLFERYSFEDAVNLQRVSLHLLPIEPISESIAPIVNNAPALRHLRLAWDYNSHLVLPSIPLPISDRRWNTLQSLSLHAASAQSLWSILHYTPQISCLWIEILPFSRHILNPPPPSAAPVSLPFLRYLSLLVLDPSYQFLELLNAPLLAELCINRTYYDDGWHGDDDDEEVADLLPLFLLNHLSKTRHSLTTLTLVSVTDFDIATFIKHAVVKDLHTMQIMNWGWRGCKVLNRCVDRMREKLGDRCEERRCRNYSVVGWEDESRHSVFKMTRGSADVSVANHADQWREWASSIGAPCGGLLF